MRDQRRSMSSWIWRRFSGSYRFQGPTAGLQWAWTNWSTGLVGLVSGSNVLVQWQRSPLIASVTSNAAVNAGAPGNQDEVNAQGLGAGNQFIPIPGRRIAIKKIAGTIDLFPTAVTLSLGDALYSHLAIMRRESSVGANFDPSIGVNATSAQPNNPYDLNGRNSAPIWYRRHCWYYGSYSGLAGNVSIQSLVSHARVNVTFRKPLVLDADEHLDLICMADLQTTLVAGLATGQYRINYLPYLSFLVKTL